MSDIRHTVRETFENPEAPWFRTVNTTIVLFALLSIVLAVVEAVSSLRVHEPKVSWIDVPTTVFFTVEYALRLWVADRKWAYVRSPLGLADLASFVPTYLGFGNFGFLKTARFVRLARLSRIENITNVSKVVKKDSVDKGV